MVGAIDSIAHYNLENPHSQLSYIAYVKQSRHFTSLYPFLCVLPSSSPAVLLYLLRSVVSPSDQTVVFTATRHHVDYLNELLSCAGIQCSCVYSSLDQTGQLVVCVCVCVGVCVYAE